MNRLISLTIDGEKVTVREDTTIIEAALQVGIEIPHLCYLRGYHASSACRLCLVEVEGIKGLVVSCSRKTEEGMVVKTNSHRVLEARQFVLEILWSIHPLKCKTCAKMGKCDLQKYSRELKVRRKRFPPAYSEYPVDESNPIIRMDSTLCIFCGRCVIVCEHEGADIIGIMHKGMLARVCTPLDKSFQESGCISCGKCVEVCPTGALSKK